MHFYHVYVVSNSFVYLSIFGIYKYVSQGGRGGGGG